MPDQWLGGGGRDGRAMGSHGGMEVAESEGGCGGDSNSRTDGAGPTKAVEGWQWLWWGMIVVQ